MSDNVALLVVVAMAAGFVWLLALIWLLADEVRRLRDEMHARQAVTRFRALMRQPGQEGDE